MDFGSSRVNDSGLIQANIAYRRVETEQITTKHSVHFKKTNDPVKPYGALGTIDEDRTSVNQSTLLKKQGAHNLNLDQSLAARSDLLGGSFKLGNNNDPTKNDMLIQSSKLEESVKAPDRLPIRIEGLTQFLYDEHSRFTGIHTHEVKSLHVYWKLHVSVAYRELFAKDRTNMPDTNMLNHLRGDTMKKSKKRRSRSSSPLNQTENKDWSKFLVPKNIDKENYGILRGDEKREQKMNIYGNLYEMDVVYTLEKDYNEEKDKEKS